MYKYKIELILKETPIYPIVYLKYFYKCLQFVNENV